MAEYNSEINEDLYELERDFLAKAKNLGSMARIEESHSQGHGTFKDSQDFFSEYEKLVVETSIALAKLKVKAKVHYPKIN